MDQKNKYAQIEENILEFWKQNKIFERSIEDRDEDNKYVFYDGPPFATGAPHYGHILSSVIKDLIPRYFTMQGQRVRRRWGWDCHGLPIETLVEKKLGISGKKEIERIGVDVFNQTARSMVLEYASLWKSMVERIGRWVEFDDSYKTMDSTYMESVWWALKTLWDKELIYEGRKVLMYCPRCETPVSNAEVSMDNSYHDVTEDSVVAKFKLKSGQKFGNGYETKNSAYILAWTTTPWTLPANVALAVGREIKYTALREKGVEGLYIIASDRVGEIFKNKEIEVVHDDITGADLDGLYYEPLYEIEAVKNSGHKAWYVTTADFVTTEDGTGVVHTAVIYGEDDFNLGLETDLPQVPLLRSNGVYNEEAPKFVQGKFYKDAETLIKKDLVSRGLIFKIFPYTHSYPFCWRCESPLIYNAISAWFIDIQKNKKEIIAKNEKINWHPEYLKHGRFKNILESAPDWNISRNRYWATPLPFWKCQKCNKAICFGSVKELRERANNFDGVYPDHGLDQNNLVKNNSKLDLHKPYIDDVLVDCECGGTMKRIDEVIDCWVESASMPFAEWHYPFENKDEFESRYPGQFIGEYIAQTRAWFYYMHVMGVLLFDDISFENVVATGTILNEKGEKLSKSKNNFIDPNIVIDQFGSDALRFYLMTSVVMQADNLFFNEKDLRDIYNKVINLFYNIVKFYEIYNSVENGSESEVCQESLGSLDKWIVSRLQSSILRVNEEFINYNTVKSGRAIKEFIDDVSTWWLRRSRDRFKNDQNALPVLRMIIRELAKMIAPFTPFVADYAWQMVRGEDEELSVHLCKYPNSNSLAIDEELEKEMSVARKIVELGHSLRSEHSAKVRQPLGKINFSYKFKYDGIVEMILEELNILEFSAVEEMKKPEESGDSDLLVRIDFHLDQILMEMGDVRELTRAIQNYRKKSGMKAGDKVGLIYSTSDEKVNSLIGKNAQKISNIADISKFSEVAQINQESAAKVDLSIGSVLIATSEDTKAQI